MFLNLRAQYSAGTTPRQTADAVIAALTPAAWYRNATGVTSAGGFASQWDDYSGNARHLVQAVGTNQPAYAAGVLTGDGADNFMIASFTLNQPSHVFAVIRQDSWTANDRLFDGGVAATTPVFQRTASPNFSSFAGNSFIDSAPDPAVGDWFICQQFLSGASSFLGVNNNAVVTGNAGTNNPGGITLFAQGGGAGTWGNASAKEIIIFSSEITGTDLSDLLSALNDLFTVY